MDVFLAKGLKRLNSFEKEKIDELSARFRQSMENNYELFKQHAFRKHTPEKEDRAVLNASLWDVMSTGLSKYSKEQILSHEESFKEKFYALLKTDDFVRSITYGPNSTKQVKHRHAAVAAMLKEVFHAN
jgi:hypothetical protein